MKGSDTMVRLGQRWAEEYMKKNKETVIQVSGGGSGTGIAALLNKATDICMASRDMKDQEYKQAKDKGINPTRVTMALDGIAIFLNKDNPITTFSVPQLKSIYTSETTNWKQMGGPDKEIILYGRENNSGTYAYFKEHVLKDDDYSEKCQTLPGTASVVNAVSKDVNGIGYGGIAWGKGIKYATVKQTDSSQAIAPSAETVSNGTYPISRGLYFFVNGTPNSDVKAFINWALSPEGQSVAKETDYVPLSADAAKKSMLK
jgi:phosphate transport system substrate-binding protein